eukprot:c18161_g1_i1 orf=583-2436(+)
MDNIVGGDINNVMDDPEGGCIVQADDPHMLAVAAFDGQSPSSTLSGNNSWYWTSMLKLMEQGAAPSSSSTQNNNTYTGAHFTPGHQASHMPASASSPSSSSVHDQPINDMLGSYNAINPNDPDNSVWGQEFLSGPIGESKTSNNIHNLACSDDGLHELLYPRTVLELLFSDQLKLEQLPSWPDILQQTAGVTPTRSFGFPLIPDKIATVPAHGHNVNTDNNFDIKIPPYLHNYSGPLADDRLSSSTASSTLSDNNTINQWAPPNTGARCENVHARMGVMHGMQQIDHTRVKQEYTHGTPSPPYSNKVVKQEYTHGTHSPPFSNNCENINNINPKLISHYMNQQQQNAGNVIHDEGMQINHEITAANFSQNLRQGGLDANNFFQHVSNHVGGIGGSAPGFDPSRVGPSSLHYINQPLIAGKKSRPLEGGASGTGQMDEPAAPKKESRSAPPLDTKPNVLSNIPSTAAANTSSPKHQHPHQQLSGAEYNFKRSRIEQNPPPPPPPPTSSCSSFKSQPVRKEKLGERITTLQQLVSPFGKTDTASVLLEAIGYIKFLQEQVQALSSPYFKSPPTQSGDRNNTDEPKPDLRSRGLCLVPLSCTMQVANDNGADYWYGGAFR